MGVWSKDDDVPPRPHLVPWYVGVTKSKQATYGDAPRSSNVAHAVYLGILIQLGRFLRRSQTYAYAAENARIDQLHLLRSPPEPPPTTTRSKS